MYKIVFWLKGSVYQVNNKGELEPDNMVQGDFVPYQSKLLINEEIPKDKLISLQKKIDEFIKREIENV